MKTQIDNLFGGGGAGVVIISPAPASSASIRRLNGHDLLAKRKILLGGLSGVCAYLHVCTPDWRSTVWQCSL